MLRPQQYICGDFIFQLFGPGNPLTIIHKPYERFHDYELMLSRMRAADEPRYGAIHKGTPFYFLAWTAFYMKDYEKAIFYMDAAISEDQRNFPDNWKNQPAAGFLTLSDKSNQAAKIITENLTARLNEHFERFERIQQKAKITKDLFVAKIVTPLLDDPPARSILTAFYSFILEFEDRHEMINLRSKNKGSIEPFLLYLFKGGLIFESLLKHFNKNDSSPNLGAFFNNKVNRDKYGVEHRDIYERDLENKLAKIIECSNSQSGVKAAFPIAYYVRNLSGHDLKRQDEFDKADDFRCLNNQIIDALLCIVAKEIDPQLVLT